MALVGTHAAIGAAASGLATAAAHQTALDATTYAGLDKTNTDSVTKVVTVGSSAPTSDGEQTWQTTSLAGTGGPTRRMQTYNSSASVALDFANAYYSAATPASGYQISGQLWYDMTLQLWRVWRTGATYDAAIAGTGLDGWHPLDTGFMLVQNETGSTIAVGKAVAFAGTTGTRRVTPCTAAKQQNVAGVVAGADIATGATGIMACVAGGAVAKVYVNVTDGNVVAGDLIAASATAGECRTVGAGPAAAHPASSTFITGVPAGAFAIALEDKALAGTVMCRMLGAVGTGATAYMPYTDASEVGTPIFSDTTPAATMTVIDFSLRDDGTNTGVQGAGSAVISTKHLPLLAVDIIVQVAANFGSGTTANALFSKNNDNINAAYSANSGSGDEFDEVARVGWCPTSIGNATAANNTAIGNKLFYRAVGGLTFTTFKIYMAAYTY